MFNFILDKDKSKTYICYYKEKDDHLNIRYQDGSTVSTENNDIVKNRLNRLQEKQIEDYNDNPDNDLNIIISQTAQVTGALFSLQCITTIVLGLIGCIFFGFKSFGIIAKVTSLGYLIPLGYLAHAIPTKIGSIKYNLFLKYKDRLNEKIDEINEKENAKRNQNTLNKVETKKIKNLCINDVNFMSYFKIKKMTRAIDKEERQLEKEIKREQINSQRARDLGIDSNKILIKRQNKK